VGFEPTRTLPRPSGFQADCSSARTWQRSSATERLTEVRRHQFIPRISRALIWWLGSGDGGSTGPLFGELTGREGARSSSRNFGWQGIAAYLRGAVARLWRMRSGLVAAAAVLLCCTSRSCRRCAAPPLLSGLAGNAEAGWRCPPTSFPGRTGLRQRSVWRGRSRRATSPRLLVAVGSRPYSRVSRRRAEVPVRLAVGGVSDMRVIPPPSDRPTLVRSISELALVAPLADGVAAPGRQPVPVTQLDLYGRRLARRSPCSRVVTRHGSSAAWCQTLGKGVVSCHNV